MPELEVRIKHWHCAKTGLHASTVPRRVRAYVQLRNSSIMLPSWCTEQMCPDVVTKHVRTCPPGPLLRVSAGARSRTSDGSHVSSTLV